MTVEEMSSQIIIYYHARFDRNLTCNKTEILLVFAGFYYLLYGTERHGLRFLWPIKTVVNTGCLDFHVNWNKNLKKKKKIHPSNYQGP